jgi:hypothetical protein
MVYENGKQRAVGEDRKIKETEDKVKQQKEGRMEDEGEGKIK